MATPTKSAPKSASKSPRGAAPAAALAPRKKGADAATAYKAGQTLVCTLVKQPRTETDEQTIQRLMRQDAGIKKALKKGSEDRMANLHVRSRGGRPWEVRAKSAKIARAEKGATWTMKFFPQIGPDLARVAAYLTVKAS